MKWLRRRKNSKIIQRNVLDVKIRSAQLRRRRAQVLLYATLAFGVVLFTLYVCWRTGDWLVGRMIYSNPAYALQTLDVQTDGVIAPEQVRRWAGVREGDNLFRLELTRIKRDLELAPAVESASVERVLPQTLRIQVVEREPVAQITTTVVREGAPVRTVSYLLDAEGYVMLPLEPRQRAIPSTPAEHYPLITGASFAGLSPGRRIELPQLHAALRLVAAFGQSPMAGLVELQRIDVSSPEVLMVTTDQQGEICLGLNDLDRQINRWRLLHDVGARQGRQIASLDLSVVENIPLRWQESSVLPPVQTPKVKKASPYKKKHV
jgi:cell division septal protein FtsQ